MRVVLACNPLRARPRTGSLASAPPAILPNVRRYTPDVFERDNVADGQRVAEWKNVANICYQGFASTAAETTDNFDVANQCTYAKKSNAQAVAGGNNKHVEILKQDVAHHQPIYKKNVLNGHGACEKISHCVCVCARALSLSLSSPCNVSVQPAEGGGLASRGLRGGRA